jgi:hypothetical protein
MPLKDRTFKAPGKKFLNCATQFDVSMQILGTSNQESAMLNQDRFPAPTSTNQLLPSADESGTPPGDDSVLPMIQQWVPERLSRLTK